MPALVVWERLIVAGDDLRLISTFMFILRAFQLSIAAPLLYWTMHAEETIHPFVSETGCIKNENKYTHWLEYVTIVCIITLVYSVMGLIIECSIFRTSSLGTPTEPELRKNLTPLCKFNMVVMLLIRIAGFGMSCYILIAAERYCRCVEQDFPNLAMEDWEKDMIRCPDDFPWKACMRTLVFTMSCDVFFPSITFLVVMRKRLHAFYRRIRPREERTAAEIEQSYQMRCQRFCECTGLLTCYLFGGSKLTAGSYVDVAIALADFLDDEGSLDIVPSDIAAAMICLVNIQKRKQMECRDQLLNEGGVLAKDKRLVGKLMRTFRETQVKSGSSKKKGSSKHNTTTDGSVKKSISHDATTDVSVKISKSTSVDNSVADIETGTPGSSRRDSRWLEAVAASVDDRARPTSLEECSLFKEGEGLEMSASLGDQGQSSSDVDAFRILISHSDENERAFKEALAFRLIRSDSLEFFEPTIRRVLDSNNFVDRMVLGEGARFCRVALAAYSWMLYVWTNKCTGCCELTADSIYRFGTCKRRGDNVIGDNPCGWKQTSVLRSIGIDEQDVLYANFNNDFGVSPYLILVDRRWKTIVLAIRGTLSLEDMISDVTISPEPLGEDLCNKCGLDMGLKDEHCHAGMLAGAKWIYSELERHKILDNAIESSEFSGFKIRVIGHSLGAGIAAILGLMLRDKYPTLNCLCFSPPGCVMSERLAKESRDYSWSYVLHNDIVPRLSFDSLVKFRNDLIEMIARIKVPKHQIFESHFFHLINEHSMFGLATNQLYEKENIPRSKFWNDFERYKERQSQRNARRGTRSYKMTIPGHIVQMVRTSTRFGNVPCGSLLSCCNYMVTCGRATKSYKVRWTEADDFQEIIISPTMMMDHFPYNVANALEAVAVSYEITSDQGREHFDEGHHEGVHRKDVQGMKKST